jgi:hypothetical protein
MKLALAGFFLCLSLVGGVIFVRTGDPWVTLGSCGFAAASIACTVGILKGYKGAKRQ